MRLGPRLPIPFRKEKTMWVYCPKCNHQKDVGYQSLYYVYSCDACGHKFRGIHAKINKWWHTFIGIVTPRWSRTDTTSCIHCGANVRGDDQGWWPNTCCWCGKNLPTTRCVDTTTPLVSQHSGKPPVMPTPSSPQPAGKPPVMPTPSSPQPDWDGCGPCTSCGFIFQMMFNNAICPKCGKKMSREDAFFSCGSYPHPYPPESQ